MKKEVVQVFLHLRDSKGWEKTITGTLSANLPNYYRLKKMSDLKKMSLTMHVDSPPSVSPDEEVTFQLYREKLEPINERFYFLHGYYEEV